MGSWQLHLQSTSIPSPWGTACGNGWNSASPDIQPSPMPLMATEKFEM